MGKRLDLTGRKFGYLVVISDTGVKKWGSYVWECLCTACGRTVFIPGGSLTRKRTPQKSCGCIKYNNLAGRKFGRLTVIEPTSRRVGRCVVWKCFCSCDNDKISYVTTSNLTGGKVSSCGCVTSEKASARMLSGACTWFGEDNPSWNSDLTDEERQNGRCYPEYIEWRTAVFERDNYTCQKCGGSSGVHLNAHHIESYDVNKDLRTTLENGVTLCSDKCHKNFHHIYGRGNNTREQFNEFMLMESTDA